MAERELHDNHKHGVDCKGEQGARGRRDHKDPAWKYALRIRSPLPTTAFMAVVVASVKKVQATIAMRSCTAKSFVRAPAFNSRLKTRNMIPKSIRGLTS